MNCTLLPFAVDWTQVLSERREPDTLVFAVPIVAIVVWGIVCIVRRLIVYRKRMAMIERGLHPDYPPEEVVEEDPAGQVDGLRDTRAYTKQ